MVLADPEKIAAIIAGVAQNIILPRFRALGDGQIHEKNPGDLVTIADIEAEQELAKQLTAQLPGSLVVGEESVAADETALDRLNSDAPVWIIDPIDGTSNFVKGKAQFGVIVALVQRQETLQGWIHDPLLYRTTHAVKGGGTWCGSRRLQISAAPWESMIGASAWKDRLRLERAGLTQRQFGSAAHEYLALLDGTLDFACYRRLHPWDHAAGVLLHGEAGGFAGLLEGGPYRPMPQKGSLLMAPDHATWSALRDLLRVEV